MNKLDVLRDKQAQSGGVLARKDESVMLYGGECIINRFNGIDTQNKTWDCSINVPL